MSTAIAAYGAILSRGDGGGSEVFTAVAEVTKITAPPLKLDVPDTTANSTTSTFTVTGSSTTMNVAAAELIPVGTVIRLTTTGTLPSGAALLTDYYVVSRGSTTATISATRGGSAITFADTGTGTHTLTAGTSWKESTATLRDPGEMALDVNFLPANDTQSGTAGLILDLKNRTLRNFKLTFPDTTVEGPFAAFVVGFKPAAPVNGALTGTVSLKLSGNPNAL